MKRDLKTRTLTGALFLSLISVSIVSAQKINQQPFLRKVAEAKKKMPLKKIPLIYAAKKAKTKADDSKMATTTRILLRKGANPTAQDESGMTALMWAAKNGANNVLITLLENPKARATINVQDNQSNTALIYATVGAVAGKSDDYVIVIRDLLEKGANPNINNTQGKAALVYAATADIHKKIGRYPQAGNIKIVDLLLRHNANPTVMAFRQTKNKIIRNMIAKKGIEKKTGEFTRKLSSSGKTIYIIAPFFRMKEKRSLSIK